MSSSKCVVGQKCGFSVSQSCAADLMRPDGRRGQSSGKEFTRTGWRRNAAPAPPQIIKYELFQSVFIHC